MFRPPVLGPLFRNREESVDLGNQREWEVGSVEDVVDVIVFVR